MFTILFHIVAVAVVLSAIYALIAIPMYRSKKRQQIEQNTFDKKLLFGKFTKPYIIVLIIGLVFYAQIATLLFYPEGGLRDYPPPMELYEKDVLSDGSGAYKKGKKVGTTYALRPRKDRQWNIPTDPQEKAAYDYAHSLKLPDSVPKPVPFDFFKARVKYLYGGKPVDEQYFEHLCQTEAGEFIFKTVDNVEGIFQLRPQHKLKNTVADFDRHALEGLTGAQGGDPDDNYNTFVSSYFIKPMTAKYRFIEQPKMGKPEGVFRLIRSKTPLHDETKQGYSKSYQTFVAKKGIDSVSFSLPWMIGIETGKTRLSRYGYTWRGIKRTADREYALAGGEYIVIDLETHEVLAVWRDFMKSGRVKDVPSKIWWGNARDCPRPKNITRDTGDTSIKYFLLDVLRPMPDVNNEYIPEEYSHLRELEN